MIAIPAKYEVGLVIRCLHFKVTSPLEIHRQLTFAYGTKVIDIGNVMQSGARNFQRAEKTSTVSWAACAHSDKTVAQRWAFDTG